MDGNELLISQLNLIVAIIIVTFFTFTRIFCDPALLPRSYMTSCDSKFSYDFNIDCHCDLPIVTLQPRPTQFELRYDTAGALLDDVLVQSPVCPLVGLLLLELVLCVALDLSVIQHFLLQ